MIKLSSRPKGEISQPLKYTKISRFTARLSSPKSRNDSLLKIFLGHNTRLADRPFDRVEDYDNQSTTTPKKGGLIFTLKGSCFSHRVLKVTEYFDQNP